METSHVPLTLPASACARTPVQPSTLAGPGPCPLSPAPASTRRRAQSQPRGATPRTASRAWLSPSQSARGTRTPPVRSAERGHEKPRVEQSPRARDGGGTTRPRASEQAGPRRAARRRAAPATPPLPALPALPALPGGPGHQPSLPPGAEPAKSTALCNSWCSCSSAPTHPCTHSRMHALTCAINLVQRARSNKRLSLRTNLARTRFWVLEPRQPGCQASPPALLPTATKKTERTGSRRGVESPCFCHLVTVPKRHG